MDFDFNKDIRIFDSIIERRPEINLTILENDLSRYYLPYIKKLIQLKKEVSPEQGIIIGVSAIQGAGKTTQGEILEILLNHFGFKSVSRSIDDHYITHRELNNLREKDPRFIRRGVTHDINLAINNLKDLIYMKEGHSILVSGYDKGAHSGDGDRLSWIDPHEGLVCTFTTAINDNNENCLFLKHAVFKDKEIILPDNMGSNVLLSEHMLPPEILKFINENTNSELKISYINDKVIISSTYKNEILVDKKDLPVGWELITNKPDFIFYDGWMLGARRVEDLSIFENNLPALESSESKQFAKDVNSKLDDYIPLWNLIHFMNVLYVPNYQISITWRDHAEEVLRSKGEGMTHEEIREFVYYFWRSVHPGIHIRNLARDQRNTQQVILINDDHSVGDILSPEEVITRNI